MFILSQEDTDCSSETHSHSRLGIRGVFAATQDAHQPRQVIDKGSHLEIDKTTDLHQVKVRP